jgi:hypothetical protein
MGSTGFAEIEGLTFHPDGTNFSRSPNFSLAAVGVQSLERVLKAFGISLHAIEISTDTILMTRLLRLDRVPTYQSRNLESSTQYEHDERYERYERSMNHWLVQFIYIIEIINIFINGTPIAK